MLILCCFFVVTLNLISVYVEFVKICTPEVRWDEESPNDLVAEAAADPRAAIDEARRTAGEVRTAHIAELPVSGDVA